MGVKMSSRVCKVETPAQLAARAFLSGCAKTPTRAIAHKDGCLAVHLNRVPETLSAPTGRLTRQIWIIEANQNRKGEAAGP
jgi:hypothetical protein